MKVHGQFFHQEKSTPKKEIELFLNINLDMENHLDVGYLHVYNYLH